MKLAVAVTGTLCSSVVLIGAIACGGDSEPAAGADQPVYIESIEPAVGSIGDEIVIRGHGFSSNENDVGFSYSDGDAKPRVAYQNGIASQDGRTLRFELEETMAACAYSQLSADEGCDDIGLMMPIGSISVAVYNDTGTSNSLPFTRQAGPIEVARHALAESPEFQNLVDRLDTIVNSSYSPSTGKYLQSYGYGFRQTDDGEVYIDLTLTGSGFEEVRDELPTEVNGYEIRVTEN